MKMNFTDFKNFITKFLPVYNRISMYLNMIGETCINIHVLLTPTAGANKLEVYENMYKMSIQLT